jgi:hypothetical protein
VQVLDGLGVLAGHNGAVGVKGGGVRVRGSRAGHWAGQYTVC